MRDSKQMWHNIFFISLRECPLTSFLCWKITIWFPINFAFLVREWRLTDDRNLISRASSQLSHEPPSAVVDSIFRSANLISCQAKRFNLFSIFLSLFRCLWWRMVARQHASSRKLTPAAVHRRRHPTITCRFWASVRAVKSRWVWLYRIQLCLTNDINLFLIRWTTNVDRIRW